MKYNNCENRFPEIPKAESMINGLMDQSYTYISKNADLRINSVCLYPFLPTLRKGEQK